MKDSSKVSAETVNRNGEKEEHKIVKVVSDFLKHETLTC